MAVDQQQLEQILLNLLPADGSALGNGQLLARFVAAAADIGHAASDDDFATVREVIFKRGVLVKGKGRGGSSARAGRVPAAAAEAASHLPAVEHHDEPFALDGGTMPAEIPAADKSPTKPKKAPTPRTAAANEEPEVLSYRHADRRKNNPEVGLVSEASDPEQPKKAWAYNPHLDQVLNFDSARAELETLVDDALASGDEAAT